MANNIGWGEGAKNNSIGWGNIGTNGFGSIYDRSRSGETLLSALKPFQDATVAYSLRDLDLGVTSNVVRVRRSSDNLEQDFTATQVTDGSLTTFCGAGDGFVSVWYDQTGVYNASQATATNQPKIVSAGALILEGGKPIIQRVNGESGFIITGYNPNTGVKQIFAVNQSPNNSILLGVTGSGDNYALVSTQFDSNTKINSFVNLSNLRKNSLSVNPTTRGDVYNLFNPQNIISFNGDFNFTGDLMIGYIQTPFSMYNMQEFIIFDTDQDVNTIKTNINNHYAIY